MAAGLGSRFGGTKQLAGVGPNGEAFLDYAIHDALAAGFGRVVLITRSEIDADVRAHLEEIHGPDLPLDTVQQDLDTRVPPRDKPWGTTHAVVCLKGAVTEPFAVLNADDFYGASSYRLLADHLSDEGSKNCLIGFRLGGTLSDTGSVTRGVAQSDGSGSLVKIAEHSEIRRNDDGAIVAAESDEPLADDTLVSMNMWGFQPEVLDLLEAKLEAFLAENADAPKAEALLPNDIGELVVAGDLTVDVLDSSEAWLGITHADDLATAKDAIAALVADGTYPASLR